MRRYSMAKKREMTLRPPSPPVDEARLKAFIEEPDEKLGIKSDENKGSENQSKDVAKTNGPRAGKIKADYPWDAPGVTPEIVKNFILRLKQPDKLKAEYIVSNSLDYKSLHEFFMKAILKQIDKDLKKFDI
jgi:hypothetical protein